MINRENNAICIVLGGVYSDNYSEIGTGKSGLEIVPSCFRFVVETAFVLQDGTKEMGRRTVYVDVIVYDWR